MKVLVKSILISMLSSLGLLSVVYMWLIGFRVVFSQFMCVIGIHKWVYSEYDNGQFDYINRYTGLTRKCRCCAKHQAEIVEINSIKWENINGL